jgi:hypothetical protein
MLKKVRCWLWWCWVNHTMPAIGPCDSDSRYWRTFAQNSAFMGQPWPPKWKGWVVLTTHQSGKRGGGTGCGRLTWYSRQVWLDSSLTYCNRVSENHTIFLWLERQIKAVYSLPGDTTRQSNINLYLPSVLAIYTDNISTSFQTKIHMSPKFSAFYIHDFSCRHN